jgi:hypothetical protein
MEFIRKPAKPRVEIELERLAGLDADELSSSRRRVRNGECGNRATAATRSLGHK